MKATNIQAGNVKWTVATVDGAPVIDSQSRRGLYGSMHIGRLTSAQARKLAKALVKAADESDRKARRS